MAAPPTAAVAVHRYEPSQASAWDEFVDIAKNATFLFRRGYMDYHADRFRDHSLLFFLDGKIVGLLPANERDGELHSHSGLTYGGVVSEKRMKPALMLNIFEALLEYMKLQHIGRLVYKAVPHIYHSMPAEEDLYALFRFGARLVRRDVSSCIAIDSKPALHKGRKWSISRAGKSGVEITESGDFAGYMELVTTQLRERHSTAPTHTGAEMQLLGERFPGNIKLYTARRDGELLGGVILYLSAQVAHVQYIAASAQGRALGAVDGIIDRLIKECAVRYFDFGISTERQGQYLNVGLAAFKEGFGARAIVYDTYEMTHP